MPGIIVTGTDTNIGKTVLSALLMSAHESAVYWKPIQSGTADETDSECVTRITGRDSSVHPEAYRLKNPLSPHLSASLDNVRIDTRNLELPPIENFLIVEGAGGVLVPVNESFLEIDLFAHWKLPVLIATRSALGTINHTLLTLEALRSRQIDILGCVTIGEINLPNEDAIEYYGRTKIVGRIPPLKTISKETLTRVYHREFKRLDAMLVTPL